MSWRSRAEDAYEEGGAAVASLFGEDRAVYNGEEFVRGDVVELVEWAPSTLIDDSQFVPPGTRGTVQGQGCSEQLWVAWDNGSRLSPTGDDKVRKVTAAR